MPSDPVRCWIDHLWEKHESFSYDGYVEPRTVRHEGRDVTLLVPEWTGKFDVVSTTQKDDLLFLLGRSAETYTRGENLGVLIVARRDTPSGESEGPETYIAFVLHALYPGALRHLRLSESAPNP